MGEEQLLLGFGNSDIGIIAMASLYSTEDYPGRACLGTSWQIGKIGKWKEGEGRVKGWNLEKYVAKEQRSNKNQMRSCLPDTDTVYMHCGDLAQACLKSLVQASMQTAKDACHLVPLRHLGS